MHDVAQHRLILVEGLPGVGKTTLAKRLADELRSGGSDVALYLEGDLHPADMQWISWMTPADYAAAVDLLHTHWARSDRSEPWEAIRSRLEKHSVTEHGMVLTAYTKMDFADTGMWSGLDPFRNAEVHNARVDLFTYRQLYLQRWQQLGDEHTGDETVIIFECAFLQSHVTEWLAYRMMDRGGIIDFLAGLLEPVRHMKPELRYIRAEDYPARIREAAAERGDWLSGLISYIQDSPYGMANGLQGFEGAMEFFRHRLEIEQLAMDSLGVPVHILQR